MAKDELHSYRVRRVRNGVVERDEVYAVDAVSAAAALDECRTRSDSTSCNFLVEEVEPASRDASARS